MEIIKTFNQVLGFLLELVMFFSIGFWGYLQGKSNFLKYTYSIVLPLIAILLWGFFASPKSLYRLDVPVRYIFEIIMFLLASFLVFKTGHSTLALLLAFVAVISELISYLLKQ